MMVSYIASKTYKQVISNTIKEQGHLIINEQISNSFDFERYIKGSIASGFSELDYFVIDLSALSDPEEQIIETLKAFRTLHENIRCIIVAPYFFPGNKALSQMFTLGIYNLIATNDFLEIKQRLEVCLSEHGMSFKDAVDFQEIKDITTVKTKEKREVSKVMIGLIGSQARIGTTHQSLILANTLRKLGYMVALAELNQSGAFEQIMNDFDVRLNDHLYFSMNGVDYYPGADSFTMKLVQEKSYNFIVMDFGHYKSCDLEYFHRHSHVKLILSGAKAWEIGNFVECISKYGDDAKRHMSIYFNFTPEAYVKELKKSFKTSVGVPLDVHFLNYVSDPFNCYTFQDVDRLLADYLPEPEGEKKGLFSWKKKPAKK
ncbi:MAG: hypothetical protein LIP16_20550 [Clostridium sp.]|nr:hypothetical protein [Clostridium sp.]